jgi:hypothetical protein
LALLLWAYLMGRLVTSAAVINESLWSNYQDRRKAHPHRPAPPDGERRL